MPEGTSNHLIFLFEFMDFGPPVSLEFRFRKALVSLIISPSFRLLKKCCVSVEN